MSCWAKGKGAKGKGARGEGAKGKGAKGEGAKGKGAKGKGAKGKVVRDSQLHPHQEDCVVVWSLLIYFLCARLYIGVLSASI